MSSETEDIVEAVEAAGLRYVTDRQPGIRRIRTGDKFNFEPDDKRFRINQRTCDRIQSLAIPPAYERVWICAQANGHLQATGFDARGRKQYRYHPQFRELRDSSKFEHVLEFATALPQIHERLDADLRRHGLPREKVLAATVYLLEKSLIRVGNKQYVHENHSYGLTTLRNRHVSIEGQDVRFTFLGKSRVKHEITLHDRRMANLVRKLQDLPGQELFQYQDSEGDLKSVTSHDVNAYLHEITGKGFTAKDFRTWAATEMAFHQFHVRELPANKTAAKRQITEVIRAVSSQLGNTPAICRKCYIHPEVIRAFADGRLHAAATETNRPLLQFLQLSYLTQ